MANGKLPLIGLAAVTLTLSACVVKIWEVELPGPEGGYAGALDVTITSNDEALLFGFTDNRETDQRSLFVAKYDNQGNSLWEYESPGLRQGSMPGGNEYITTDTDNAALFAGFSLDEPATLIKVGPDGSPSWEVSVGGKSSFPVDIETISNELVLVAEISAGFSTLHAFSGSGDILWMFQDSQDSCGEAGCAYDLEEYPGRAAPPPAFALTEIAIMENDDIIFNNGETITRLNTDGNVLSQISAQSLGMNLMADMAVNGYEIAVLGKKEQGSGVAILDNTLAVTDQYETELSAAHFFRVAINQSATICLVAIHDNVLSVQGLGHGINWSSQFEHELNYEGLTGLFLKDNNECYVSTVEPNEPAGEDPVTINPWTSTTLVLDSTGKRTDRFSLRHFIGYSMHVKGNHIYSAGQSGAYIDGDYPLETNAAKLVKHQRR